MIEEYRAVKGYEGLYEVSNFGNIKSLKRKRVLNDKILNPPINQKGYRLVNLNKNGLKYKIEVHQLIAIAFLNHIPNGFKIVVDHIDNNKLNNRLDNLQLITNRENCSKDKNGTSKYTGVHWNKQCKKWHCSILINGKSKYLGLYTNEIQASNAYQHELKRIQQHDRII